jgi:hypothetical protein
LAVSAVSAVSRFDNCSLAALSLRRHQRPEVMANVPGPKWSECSK